MRFWKEIKNYFGRTRGIVAAAFFLGLSIALISEHYITIAFWKGLFIHIGIAFMVASIVGLLLELTEVKNFFEERLTKIMEGEEFLNLLSDEKMEEYNLLCMEKRIQKKISNPTYDYISLPNQINEGILSEIGGVYQDEYSETIEYNLIGPKIEGLPFSISPSEGISVAKINRDISFELVSPYDDKEVEHTIEYLLYSKKIPKADNAAHFDVNLKIDDKNIPIAKENLIEEWKEFKDYIFLNFKYKHSFLRTSGVEITFTQYESGKTGSFFLYIENLTKGVSIHFSSGETLDLDAEIFGLSPNYYQPSITQNAVSMKYPGWALPGHGFFIRWEEL